MRKMVVLAAWSPTLFRKKREIEWATHLKAKWGTHGIES
ncbi:MAG: hypothetical protein JWO91_2052 [Acidobacteriaceae bacterium]|nr:hypothetical protein [Acidobacteriaceae bacterium]